MTFSTKSYLKEKMVNEQGLFGNLPKFELPGNLPGMTDLLKDPSGVAQQYVGTVIDPVANVVVPAIGKHVKSQAGEIGAEAGRQFGAGTVSSGTSQLASPESTKALSTAGKAFGSGATSGALSSLGTSLKDPKTLAAIGAGTLATGALLGAGSALGKRVFGRRKEKEKKSGRGYLAASTNYNYSQPNPYATALEPSNLAGGIGALGGSLGGFAGGGALGALGAQALGLKPGGFGAGALRIGGQAVGSVLGGALGGAGGFELFKKRKKKKDNPMLPDMYRNA